MESAADPAGGAMVLAVTSSPEGSAGDYKATSLSSSATWQTGTQTGDFTWSYPIRVPPVPGGLTPPLSIDYDSANVDGKTANTNNQTSQIGEGFDLWPGYIQRGYKSCKDDGAPKDQYGNDPGDQCWGYDNASITWNGKGGELIPDGNGKWHLKNDDGTRIEKLTDTSTANGDNDGEYWKVTTLDGTAYYFGLNRPSTWATNNPETDSTWTTPVYGNNSGEPCYKSTGFTDSWCQQAWRWNLDYVVDPHGNAAAYYYKSETNHYGRNLKPEDETPYDRGGYLDHIEYGLRTNNLWPAHAPARVDFTNDERCIPDANVSCDPATIAAHPDYWWDVPWDLHCDSGQDCKDDHGSSSPTFWTRKWLSKIATKIWDPTATTPGYRPVDSWTLGHEWNTADVERALMLESIQHTGLAGATAVELPLVTFNHQAMPNRIDGINADVLSYWRPRVTTIYDESGGQIDVNYTPIDCSATDRPTPETNTRRCYPTYWQPAGHDTPIQDWFHKYAVSKVIQTDRTGGAPDMVTSYDYQGGAAWHYDDDDGLTKEKYKTWSQWRGYGKVIVSAGGNGSAITQTDHLYMRGMNGDRLNSSGGTKPVTVSDGETGSTPISDHESLQGFELKTTTYDNPGGTWVKKTINTPGHDQTASRTRSWGTVAANLVHTDGIRTLTNLGSGTTRETTRTNTYDATTGLILKVDDQGQTSPALSGDEKCTVTNYAQNTNAWMMKYPSRARVTTGIACGNTPTDYTTQLISDLKTSYDGQISGTAPKTGDGTPATGGNVTTVEQVGATTTSGETFVPREKHTYDKYGRALTATLTNSEPITDSTKWVDSTTTTTYTEDNGGTGLTTGVSIKTPPAGAAGTELTTSQVIDPALGAPTRKTDAGSKNTDLAYDALGRTTKVWLPNRSKANNEPPNLEFVYQVGDGITAVATKTLKNDGSQTTNWELLDGWLRSRQTQVPGPSGGRLLTDTFYDSVGKVARTYAAYYDDQKAPEATLFGVDTIGNVETQTVYNHDGLGRTTLERNLSGTSDSSELWRTTTSYGANTQGDWVKVVPPAGGIPTTTYTNALGQTTKVSRDKGDGTTEDSTFSYWPAGQLKTITGPGGKTWSYIYDVRGRKTSETDPDKGTTTSAYDGLDRLLTTKDARSANNTIAYVYDGLGRKIEEHDGSATGTKLASWVYDTIRKGQPTSSTRWVGTAAYTTAVGTYDGLNRPTRTTITPDSSLGANLAPSGGYLFTTSYNLDGTVAGTGMPAAGGLPTESVYSTYDDLGRLTQTTSSLSTYVNNTIYTYTGKPLQLELTTGATGAKKTWQDYTYAWGSQRLTEAKTTREGVAGIDRNSRYRYDDVGNVLQITDTSRSGTDNQCFTYDGLQRLTDAWTQTPDAQGNASCTTAAAAIIGGPSGAATAGYRINYTYDPTGNRDLEKQYAPSTTTAGGTLAATRDYKYSGETGVGSSVKGHMLGATTQTGTSPFSGAAHNDSYTYDATGNPLTRTIGTTSQTLKWDTEGQLASIDETISGTKKTASYIYNTDGSRLLRTDPDGTKTLYLPGMELKAVGTATATATRYYSHAGQSIALRTSTSNVRFIVGDHHGTGELQIDGTTQSLTQRRTTPFGQNRGTSTGTWTGEKAFVGGTKDPTSDTTGLVALTRIGARDYDPNTGRFINVDPVFDTKDPQSWNGYAYADNNPTTISDPSGLCPRSADCEGVTNPGQTHPQGATTCHDSEGCGKPGCSYACDNSGSGSSGGAPNYGGPSGGLGAPPREAPPIPRVFPPGIISQPNMPMAPPEIPPPAFGGPVALVVLLLGLLAGDSVQPTPSVLLKKLPKRQAVAVDNNVLVAAITEGKSAEVDGILAGRIPVVSPQALKEFVGENPLRATLLASWMKTHGGRMGMPEREGELNGWKQKVNSIRLRGGSRRILQDADARVLDSAAQEGLSIYTYDRKFGRALQSINYPVELYNYGSGLPMPPLPE